MILWLTVVKRTFGLSAYLRTIVNVAHFPAKTKPVLVEIDNWGQRVHKLLTVLLFNHISALQRINGIWMLVIKTTNIT